ncbi:MAG TPA: hypothetical protein ENG39_00095, partial [Candidatus Omnitrophica bacterium]|nr:hypothetical protein [Candidatus Omnitrophota bacterium]
MRGNKKLLYVVLIISLGFLVSIFVLSGMYIKEQRLYSKFIKFASDVDYHLRVLGAKYLSEVKDAEKEKKLRE